MENQLLGFVGVGRMGGPMSSRLLDAGHSLCVFDTSVEAVKPLAARGARVATSPAEVASSASVVLMSLPTPAIVQSVALGDDGLCHGSTVRTVIDLSTSGPGMANTVARGLGDRRITLVDSRATGNGSGTCPDLVSEKRPVLINSTCDHSGHIKPHEYDCGFESFGVCTND